MTALALAATGVANPLEPGALLIFATALSEELQSTKVVRFCVVLSEYIPVAVKGTVNPKATLELAGVTVMDARVALVTVNTVAPEILPCIAVMVVRPTVFTLVKSANPWEKISLLILNAELEEIQRTDFVMSCVVLSEYIPVAVNCVLSPKAIFGLVGVTSIDVSTAPLTVNCVEPEIPFDVAVIMLLPEVTEVTKPLEFVSLLTVATTVLAELQ
ncbi:MAG: hypothetical protein Q7S51_06345, partial [Gallionellaceae bacterium]|nr:hypothetical protein [Gallionellaceae bacterium]